MSAGFRGRRRRSRGRRGGSLAGDPLDLFLDAITNALGVIMFILLMVVLFGRATDSPATAAAPSAAAELRDLEEQLRTLQERLDALPPVGDPDLAARWKAAMARLPKLEDEVTVLRSEAASAEEAEASAAAALDDAKKRERELSKEVDASPKASERPTGFIRVSRFQQDDRKSVILLLSDGRLSRFRATPDTKLISAPATGTPVPDAAAASSTVRDLLSTVAPGTHRVELVVWEGSFREAKLVEQAIQDAGFDSNPLPVRAGNAVPAGAGGVQ